MPASPNRKSNPEGFKDPHERSRRPRLLLIGPRVIDNDIVGGTQVQFEQVLSRLRARSAVRVAVIDTARPLANRTRLGKLLLDARAFLRTMVRTWRRAPAADLVLWYVSWRAALLGGSFIRLVCAMRRRPLCICFFGGGFDARLASSSRVHRFIATRTLLRVDLVLCETRRLAAALGASFKTAWLPNTRDMPPRRTPYRASCRRLLFLSGLDPRKGLSELIRAAPRLPPFVQLSVFGPQPSTFDVRSLDCLPNVTYGGVVAPDRVPEIIEAHDALVFPTRYPHEGYPGVVIEAFQMGLPAIVTRHSGLQELVTHGKDGLCVAVGSVESLLEAVVRLCSDDRLFVRLRGGALETGRRFRCDRAAIPIEDLCRDVAARAGDAAERP